MTSTYGLSLKQDFTPRTYEGEQVKVTQTPISPAIQAITEGLANHPSITVITQEGRIFLSPKGPIDIGVIGPQLSLSSVRSIPLKNREVTPNGAVLELLIPDASSVDTAHANNIIVEVRGALARATKLRQSGHL